MTLSTFSSVMSTTMSFLVLYLVWPKLFNPMTIFPSMNYFQLIQGAMMNIPMSISTIIRYQGFFYFFK
jgi:hypothetical protein